MSKVIRIGTRDSELALWQANTVKKAMESYGHRAELVPVKSMGDINLKTPLYEMGVTGVFTKSLDLALLNGRIDIAVHSLKDVPTLLPKGIVQTAVLERASSEDILIPGNQFNPEEKCTIATGSLRRKAQWLHRYPQHEVVGLRGNVNSRLKKLKENNWQGAIFARAGLERIDILPKQFESLNWMVPAPAQGAMAVVALASDDESIEATSALNHPESELCTAIEREFLRVLEGGCSAPIGAHAQLDDKLIHFKGVLLSLDGRRKLEIDKTVEYGEHKGFGEKCAKELLADGGKELMEEIRKAL